MSLTYLFLILGFSTPILLFLAARKWSVLRENARTILLIAILGFLFQFVTEPIGLSLHAWAFTGTGVLGIWLFGYPVEELLLATLFPLTFAAVIVVLLDYKRRGKFRFLVG